MVAISDPSIGVQVALAIVGGGLALLSALYFTMQVFKYNMDEAECTDAQKTEIERLRKLIYHGASSFLKTEYTWVGAFVLFMFVALSMILITAGDEVRGVLTGVNLIIGSSLSAFAGFIGMYIATNANSRTTLACTKDITEGLRVSFASGAVMSNSVVGLGLLGVTIMYLIFESRENHWGYISGFGFGASCMALFARVGGGVFTKAADVGADLVGKVEQGIPEDDPRNPAVVADNVGDNVGDVAGMGADLYESFVGSLIATATLGSTMGPMKGSFIALPFWISGLGIIASLIGTVVVRSTKLPPGTSLHKLLNTIGNGIFVSMFFTAAFALIPCLAMFESDAGMRLWGCVVIGMVAGEVIGKFTEFCTSYEEFPTRGISSAAEFGSAPVIIKGFGVGMISVIVPTLSLAITIIVCKEIAPYNAGLYGISLAAVGLLSTLGITLATDAYGPVADNAGGIAEMAGLPSEVRDRTDALDSLGNTTAATGKGFAIGSAVLTSVGLIAAFLEQAQLSDTAITLRAPLVLVGVLIGAMLPFLFGALTMLSVDRSARAMITEVRLQFAQCPHLMMKPGQSEEDYDRAFAAAQVNDPDSEYFGKLEVVDPLSGEKGYYPDTDRCVAIATTSAIQEMMLPGTLAVFSPVVIGYLLGAPSLAGLLVGALTSGFMLALTMANAGGAWDNAKKWVEKCAAEGEPVKTPEGEVVVVYRNYGVKKGQNAKDLAADEKTRHTLLRDGENADNYKENDEAVEALAERMTDLYHERHEPAVVGDTVGDPFKDTSGPSLNILIKLMSIVSLVLAPTFEDSAFRGSRWWIGLVVLVVVAIACTVVVHKFHEINKKRSNEAIELKKKADAAFLDQEEQDGAAAADEDDKVAGAAATSDKKDEVVDAEDVEAKAE